MNYDFDASQEGRTAFRAISEGGIYGLRRFDGIRRIEVGIIARLETENLRESECRETKTVGRRLLRGEPCFAARGREDSGP